MSEVSHRPRILVISDVTTLGVASAGAVLVGATVGVIARGLTAAAQRAYRELCTPAPSVNGLVPACSLKRAPLLPSHQVPYLRGHYGLSGLEAHKVQALLGLHSASFAGGKLKLEQPLEALCYAADVHQVEEARATVWNTLVAQNDRLLVETIARACVAAAHRVDFDQTRMESTGRGVLRVISQDKHGRYLISEVGATGPSREPSLTTEVVNCSDGSCHELLDEYNKALDNEGVRSEPPQRKPTGGVCESEYARELLRSLSNPPSAPEAAKNARKMQQERRRKKLNIRIRVSRG